MASVLTLFYNNPQQSGSSAGLLDVNQPTASTSTTGWTVGTTSLSFPFSLLSYDAKKTNFNTSARPTGGPVTAAGHFAEDSYRLSVATSGTFSAGTWYSSGSMIAVTNASGQQGRLDVRIWRSSSLSGASPTELTKSIMTGSIAVLSTTVAASSSASTQIASVTLNNEYLFVNMSWEITTAGTNSGADTLFRFGPATDVANGSFLVTPTFTPTGGGGATPAAGFYTHRKHYELVN